MPDLLSRVGSLLRDRRVGAALIGANALASFGVSRSTHDIDLLVVDRAVLDAAFWVVLTDVVVDVRRGDADDPLAGVVRCRATGSRPVDIVVGRYRWMQAAIERARPGETGVIPIVERADWVCLKLFAGGVQDLNDVQHLRAVIGPPLDAEVADRLGDQPTAIADVWRQLIAGG